MTVLLHSQKPPWVHADMRCSYHSRVQRYCPYAATHLVAYLNPPCNTVTFDPYCEQHAQQQLADARRETRHETFRNQLERSLIGMEIVPITWYVRPPDRVTLFDDNTEYDDDDDENDDDDDDDWVGDDDDF